MIDLRRRIPLMAWEHRMVLRQLLDLLAWLRIRRIRHRILLLVLLLLLQQQAWFRVMIDLRRRIPLMAWRHRMVLQQLLDLLVWLRIRRVPLMAWEHQLMLQQLLDLLAWLRIRRVPLMAWEHQMVLRQ